MSEKLTLQQNIRRLVDGLHMGHIDDQYVEVGGELFNVEILKEEDPHEWGPHRYDFTVRAPDGLIMASEKVGVWTLVRDGLGDADLEAVVVHKILEHFPEGKE